MTLLCIYVLLQTIFLPVSCCQWSASPVEVELEVEVQLDVLSRMSNNNVNNKKFKTAVPIILFYYYLLNYDS
jgi:hypothetical protein